jgi:hypothetical protein
MVADMSENVTAKEMRDKRVRDIYRESTYSADQTGTETLRRSRGMGRGWESSESRKIK